MAVTHRGIASLPAVGQDMPPYQWPLKVQADADKGCRLGHNLQY